MNRMIEDMITYLSTEPQTLAQLESKSGYGVHQLRNALEQDKRVKCIQIKGKNNYHL